MEPAVEKISQPFLQQPTEDETEIYIYSKIVMLLIRLVLIRGLGSFCHENTQSDPG